jgi:hypothetical protein
VSTRHLVAFVAKGSDRTAVTEAARRRFGGMSTGPVIGGGTELVDPFAGFHRRGVDRFTVWFTDLAPSATLESFCRGVIAAFGA